MEKLSHIHISPALVFFVVITLLVAIVFIIPLASHIGDISMPTVKADTCQPTTTITLVNEEVVSVETHECP